MMFVSPILTGFERILTRGWSITTYSNGGKLCCIGSQFMQEEFKSYKLKEYRVGDQEILGIN